MLRQHSSLSIHLYPPRCRSLSLLAAPVFTFISVHFARLTLYILMIMWKAAWEEFYRCNFMTNIQQLYISTYPITYSTAIKFLFKFQCFGDLLEVNTDL